MKTKLPIVVLVLVWVVGLLVFSPLSRGSSSADLGRAVEPSVFLAEIEDEVCASRSPVHTSSSLTAVSADMEHGDNLPSVFLVMLEDGVCTSLSPISTSTRVPAQADREEFDSIDRKTAALGAEIGVWYVQQ